MPDQVDYLNFTDLTATPKNKHLSVNTMRISFKQIKKVAVVRKFIFSKSVFYDFSFDTNEKLAKAFEQDA